MTTFQRFLRPSLVIAALLMALFTATLATPAHAATYQAQNSQTAQTPQHSSYVIGSPASKYGQVLGGVDFDGYCKSMGWTGVTQVNWSAGGWECYWGQVAQTYNIDSDAACNYTYQTTGLEAVVQDWYNAQSIVCVRTN